MLGTRTCQRIPSIRPRHDNPRPAVPARQNTMLADLDALQPTGGACASNRLSSERELMDRSILIVSGGKPCAQSCIPWFLEIREQRINRLVEQESKPPQCEHER